MLKSLLLSTSIFISLVAVFASKVQAQKTVTHQSLFWMRYNSQLNFNKKVYWSNDIEERRFFAKNKHHHLIIHSRLHYKIIKNLDIGAGLTYSLQSPNDPKAVSQLVVPEFRPVQQIAVIDQLTKKFYLEHRLRIDERFIRKNNGTDLLPGYDFNFRFRYRLQANYRINKDDNKARNTILKVADEIMFNAGKTIVNNHFDQNRIYIGVERGIKENLAVEFTYLHWYQKRASGIDYFDRDILRVSVNHKMSLKK